MDFSKLTADECHEMMKGAHKRLEVLKMEEASSKIASVRPGNFVRLRNGKVGKVLMVGENELRIITDGEDSRKMTVKSFNVEGIFTTLAEAKEEKKPEPKAEVAAPAPAKKGFGRR